MANPHPDALLRSLVTLGFSTQASTRCSFTKRARRHGGRVVGHHGSTASSLGSGVRALSSRSPASCMHRPHSPTLAPTSLSPSASLTASSLAFRVQRRSAREHPLLGPQVAVAARRHRRRCRLAEGRLGRGRPAKRRHMRSMGRGGCGGPPPAATAVGGTVGTAGAAALDSRLAAAAGPPRCRSTRLSH
jgi:hypothetical protein